VRPTSASMGQEGGVIGALNTATSASRHLGIGGAVDHARQVVQERAQGASASYRQVRSQRGRNLSS
jgi:hypothetical protein